MMGMADPNPAPTFMTVKMTFEYVRASDLDCIYCHRAGCEYEMTHHARPGSRVTVGAHRDCLERIR